MVRVIRASVLCLSVALSMLTTLIVTPAAHATTIPSAAALGLNPGDIYQLVFVTSATTASSTAGSAYYNNFVQTAANDAGIGSTLGITWKAIVSTGTQASPTPASTNAPVAATSKVYLLNATQIANGTTNPFYSGSVDHLAAMNISELLTTVNRNVWTGGNASGSESGSGLLGQPADANGPVYGFSGGTSATSGAPNAWSRVGNNGAGNFSSPYSLYAVSNVLTAAVPEPASLFLFATGATFLLVGSLNRAIRKKGQVG